MKPEIEKYGLIDRSSRIKRTEDIRKKVLNFLYYEPYAIPHVLQKLLGYKTYIGTQNALKLMEGKKLLRRKITTDLAGRRMSLWGISAQGCSVIYDPDKMPTSKKERTKGFDKSKIFLSTLQHLTEIQYLKISIITSNKPIKLKYISPEYWKNKEPDVLFIMEKRTGESINCIEVELTIKSIKRYKSIIFHYRKEKNAGSMDSVYWVTDTEKKKNRLEKIFMDLGADDFHKFRTIIELKL